MKTMPDRHNNDAINEDLLKQLAYNDKMAELGRVSAGLVHELNAPLSVITSASQMILREEGVTEFVREMIERINSEAQRLSRLTRSLLNFSSQNETISEIDLNLTTEFVLEFLQYEAAKRGVTFKRNLNFNLPVIHQDDNLIKQILLNLIMNALHAMESKGGELLISTATLPDFVSLTVSDTGPGIPADSINRIFDRYFTTKKPGEGTGLGLFITKSLIEMMGGTIKVKSSIGIGTTFTVLLPANE